MEGCNLISQPIVVREFDDIAVVSSFPMIGIHIANGCLLLLRDDEAI